MTGRSLVVWFVLAALLPGCGGRGQASLPASTPTIPRDLIPSALPAPPATITPIAFPAMTSTLPPTESPYLPFTPTSTLTLTDEPAWHLQGPGEIVVPILLYHHIGFSRRNETTYYVSPEAFDQQMNLLYQWGYTTISVTQLTRAILQGAELPPRPVLLTFDDGSATTSFTALAVLQRYGFTAAAYVVYNYIGSTNYMSAEEILQLHAAGWEIGSHGLSHVDLTTRPDRQRDEIVQSRRQLEALLGVPVQSFAYPFGAYDETSLGFVHQAGYAAAMGLGRSSLQGPKNLFYLYRQPVPGSDDLPAFAARLPWRQEVYDLPALTIVP